MDYKEHLIASILNGTRYKCTSNFIKGAVEENLSSKGKPFKMKKN